MVVLYNVFRFPDGALDRVNRSLNVRVCFKTLLHRCLMHPQPPRDQAALHRVYAFGRPDPIRVVGDTLRFRARVLRRICSAAQQFCGCAERYVHRRCGVCTART